MNINEKNISVERHLIWILLSEFYLDTELQETDFIYMARQIADSQYSLEDVKEINKYEVFPVLQVNLLSVAGEWAGFDEKWLVQYITDSLTKRNVFSKIGIECYYFLFKWMCKDYWIQLEMAYKQIKSNPTLVVPTNQSNSESEH